MENELDGILNWMLEGLGRLLINKTLTAPASSFRALEEYRVENNSVLQFVDAECILGRAEKIDRTFLYIKYTEWCKENGFSHKVISGTFYKTLESEFGIVQQKSHGRRMLAGMGQVHGMFG